MELEPNLVEPWKRAVGEEKVSWFGPCERDSKAGTLDSLAGESRTEPENSQTRHLQRALQWQQRDQRYASPLWCEKHSG